jgi:hypothetical protein
MSGDLLPSDFETDNIPAEEDGRETTSGPAATTHYEDFKIFFSLATEASGYLKAVYRNDPTATGAKYISDRIAEAVKRISENPLTSGPAASECPTCAHRKKHFGWSAAFLCTDPWHETNARASFTGPAASAEHRCQELIVCNETREHAIHDPAEGHRPFKESAEPRTQGMSAKPRHWDVELFWREWANQQYFTIAITDNIKHVAKCFAISFCEQETIRLREALRHAQSTVGFFASVIKSGERWSATCQEALDKVSSAAAPTKKTDSPK